MKKYKKSSIRKQLGRFVKVCPIISDRSGEAVRNQYEIIFENGSAFQSYDTFIGALIKGKLYLAEEHDCSVTTSKYCTSWCGRNGKERRKGLEEERYFLMVD